MDAIEDILLDAWTEPFVDWDDESKKLLLLPHNDIASYERDVGLQGPAAEVAAVAMSRARTALGRAAQHAFAIDLRAALGWAQERYRSDLGPFEAFGRALAHRTWCDFVNRFGRSELRFERRDEVRRDRAGSSDRDLTEYLSRWRKRVIGFQVAYPRRWHVPGRTPNEIRDDAELLLIEMVREDAFAPYERTGVEATYLCLTAWVRAEKKRRRIFLVPRTKIETPVSDAPTPEQIVLQREREEEMKKVVAVTGAHLTRRQRLWWEEMKKDEFPDGRLNLARVAEAIDRNRSSGHRAKAAVARTLRKLGAKELLNDE